MYQFLTPGTRPTIFDLENRLGLCPSETPSTAETTTFLNIVVMFVEMIWPVYGKLQKRKGPCVRDEGESCLITLVGWILQVDVVCLL